MVAPFSVEIEPTTKTLSMINIMAYLYELSYTTTTEHPDGRLTPQTEHINSFIQSFLSLESWNFEEMNSSKAAIFTDSWGCDVEHQIVSKEEFEKREAQYVANGFCHCHPGYYKISTTWESRQAYPNDRSTNLPHDNKFISPDSGDEEEFEDLF